MAVKIIIKRRVPKEKEVEIQPLLNQLRSKAIALPDYISGETLKNVERPNEFLVISTWQSSDDWNRWVQNDKRREIQEQIDFLLQAETEYSIYHYA